MIATQSLILRVWQDADRALFHALGNDPGPIRTRGDDDAACDRQGAFHAQHGTCGWLVERRSDGVTPGMCGTKPARPGLPIAGEMKIGWRFEPEHRGQGYAIEAARVAGGDFGHSFVVDDSPLKRHLFYRIDRPA